MGYNQKRMKTFPRQAQAFEYADSNALPVLFKVFPPPTWSHRFSACGTQAELAKFIMKRQFDGRTCQELLRDGTWLSPYWDIDQYTEVTDIREHRKQLITAFELVCTKVFPLIGETFNPVFCRWSDSSGVDDGKFKVSLHCVYIDPSIGFEYNRANKEGREKRKAMLQFGKLCIRESLKHTHLNEAGVSFIDGTVYSTNRAMRMVGCHKPKSNRVLQPLSRDTWDVDNEFGHTDIETHMIARFRKPERPCKIRDVVELAIQPEPVCTKSLEKIAQDIGCTIDTINGSLVTLKTCATGRVCPISKQRYMPGNNRCYMILRDDEVLYAQFGIPGTKKIGEHKPKVRKYTMYRDIQKLFRLKRIAGDDFTVKMMKEYIHDVVIYIQKPYNPEFYVRVDGYDHGFGLSEVDSYKYEIGKKLFEQYSPKFICRSVRNNKKGIPEVVYTEQKMSTVLEDMIGANELASYGRAQYVPFCLTRPFIGTNTFNTFVPFSLLNHTLNPTKPFTEHAMYKLMRTDLTGGSDEAFQYLLSYIAHKLQKPHIRIDTALAFVRTVAGIGKGQMSKFLRVMFDNRNCCVVSNLDHLFGQFNSHLRTSLWVFLEEVKGKGSAWELAGRLKDLISSESQLWEKKHHETESGGWFGSIVIFSNDSYGIRVEATDRRYCLFDTDYTLRDDNEFHNLVDHETMDADYMTTAFHFFLNRDISNWNWRNIPKTKTRTQVKRACETVIMTFTRWFFQDEGNFEYNRGLFGYNDDWIWLKKEGNDYSCVTYKTHLIGAFREFKERTQHPTKIGESNSVLEGIKLLWGKHLKPGHYKTRQGRHRGFKITSLRALQQELSKQFRDPVILEILQNETS